MLTLKPFVPVTAFFNPRSIGKAKGLDLIPFPLGDAFELMAQNKAIVIPAVEALQAAAVSGGIPIRVETAEEPSEPSPALPKPRETLRREQVVARSR